MRGLKTAFTVRELKQALDLCPEDSNVFIMPEDSDGFRIGGVINLPSQEPKQVWLLLEEDVAEHERDTGAGDDDEEDTSFVRIRDADSEDVEINIDIEPEDVIQVRGQLKSA